MKTRTIRTPKALGRAIGEGHGPTVADILRARQFEGAGVSELRGVSDMRLPVGTLHAALCVMQNYCAAELNFRRRDCSVEVMADAVGNYLDGLEAVST